MRSHSQRFPGALRWIRDARMHRARRGAASPVALILMTTLIAVGSVVGLVSLRDQMVQELGDIAVGLDALDQSFSYRIELDTDGDGVADETKSASFNDLPILSDTAGSAPACLNLTVVPVGE